MRWRDGTRERGSEGGMKGWIDGGRGGEREGWIERGMDRGREHGRDGGRERERWKMGGRVSLGIILGEIIPCNCSPSTFGSCSLIFEMSSFLPRTLTLHDSPLVPRVPCSFPVSLRDVPFPLPPNSPFYTSSNLTSYPMPSSIPSPLIPFSTWKSFEAR